MTGTYTLPAIPPYCKAITEKVRVLEWRGHRVLLESLGKPYFRIETELDSFTPDIPLDSYIPPQKNGR